MNSLIRDHSVHFQDTCSAFEYLQQTYTADDMVKTKSYFWWSGDERPTCELNICVLQQQQNQVRGVFASEVDLSPLVAWVAVRSKSAVLLLLI